MASYKDEEDTSSSYPNYEPPLPYYPKYYQEEVNDNFEQDWDCNRDDPEMILSSCDEEEYYDYGYDYPQATYKDPQEYNDQRNYERGLYSQEGEHHSQRQFPYQIQENVPNEDAELFQNNFLSKENNNLARFELMLSKIDETLSQHHLSDQQRIDFLRSKCEVLSIKIKLEESFEDEV